MKLLTSLLGLSQAQWLTNYAPGHAGMIHLFEWHWAEIAAECEAFLGPRKWGGVQVSPPNENRIINDRPWWERYQPISYKLETRSGNRAAFIDMVDRCNAVGVRIYPDVIPNHMCGGGGSGTGTGGSYFDAGYNLNFEGVPYSRNDFNDDKCYTSSGNIENYGDATQVRNCRLVNLVDLDQSKSYVRGKIGDYLSDLINIGSAGFRVDACKHMWPGDLEAIFGALPNLPTSKGFEPGSRAFIAQEVIDQGGEPITASEYTGFGRVTEFKYCFNAGNNVYTMRYLETLGQSWGMMGPFSALVFLNNHDNQRGHGGGGHTITFEEPWELKLMTAFMMAHDYGEPRVMSSYYFSNGDQGPPGQQPNAYPGDCGNGWVCEHRWPAIQNLAMFRGSVSGDVKAWTNGGDNQIAFSRGSSGFIAINGGSGYWSGSISTTMPDGEYCDLIQGDPTDTGCTGPTITVSGGKANINVPNGDRPISAISVAYPSSGGGGLPPVSTTPGSGGGGDCTSCSTCTVRRDCGELASTEASCQADGCLWCPSSKPGDPWCVHPSAPAPTTSPPSSSCNVSDSDKRDCGYVGTNQSSCIASGCCWEPAYSSSSIPWCYFPQ